MDTPDPELGVRAGSLEQWPLSWELIGISQEKWRRKGAEGRGNSMVRILGCEQPWQCGLGTISVFTRIQYGICSGKFRK